MSDSLKYTIPKNNGFLKGIMENSETGTLFKSDTSPDATTLGKFEKLLQYMLISKMKK